MKVSMQAAMILSAVFAIVCLGVAFTGFTSFDEIQDPAQMSDAKGFAWFWTFLGCVAIGFGLLAWWLIRTQKPHEDD